MADLAFLDLETTGLNKAGKDEILEIGIIDGSGRVLINQLVRPVRHSRWDDAQRVNGISPHDVQSSPTFDQIESRVISAIRGKTLVAWNAQFDTSFVPHVWLRAIEIVDAMEKFRRKHPGVRSSLQAASQYLRVPVQPNHRALDDARVLREIWIRLG